MVQSDKITNRLPYGAMAPARQVRVQPVCADDTFGLNLFELVVLTIGVAAVLRMLVWMVLS